MNLVLVTSVIDPPQNPLSYSKTRSVFSKQERFLDTILTINSIRNKIPNSLIVLVECSDLTPTEEKYFTDNCDYLLNLWSRKDLHDKIFGSSKSLGEGTMTIEVLKYIQTQRISYQNLIKISGRYWLTDKFNYQQFNNNKLVCHRIRNNENNVTTVLYKLSSEKVHKFLDFLVANTDLMYKKIGFEVLFAKFVNLADKNSVLYIDQIGITGKVTINGKIYEK